MKKYLIILATLLMAFVAQARNEEPDANYRLIRHSYTVNEDGSVDYNFRKELTILRNRALTAYADKGETFIVYNPAFETLKINESYTIRKDGSRVQTPKNAFVQQLPSNCEDCGRYNGLRELAIVHTGMEYGCTIVLDYTIHRKSNKVFASHTLAEDCPIDRYEIILKQPKGNIVSWNKNVPAYSNVKINEESNGDGTYVRFVATNVPQKLVENYLPNDNELYPSISISNGHADNWFNFKADDTVPEAKDLLALIYENNPVEYINVIANYVVDNVATNDISPDVLDYVVSPATVTWQSNCGTPCDKTQLLSTMLREAGFKPQVVIDKENLMVKVPIDGREYEVSAIAKNALMNAADKPKEQELFSVEMQWDGKDIGNGYSQSSLVQRDMGFDASLLLSDRKAPLAIHKSESNLPYSIMLPQDSKLVTKPYNKRLESKTRLADGSPLWSMLIRLEQRGSLLHATRVFSINESRAISGKEYQEFRNAMIDWQTSATITIKK